MRNRALTEYLDHLPVLQLSLENVEADDIVIGCNSGEYEMAKLIISNDRDLFNFVMTRRSLSVQAKTKRS